MMLDISPYTKYWGTWKVRQIIYVLMIYDRRLFLYNADSRKAPSKIFCLKEKPGFKWAPQADDPKARVDINVFKNA